ncbi:MAG: twin-arginine translocase subunit TatC [Myxococcaceae bacterium]
MSTTPPETEQDGDLRMSLFGHLAELRSRLFRVVIAIIVLGGASLVFARPIFGLLMRPVLDALPPEARSLVYTSGIEEINVLMKVGMYAGIFLATPVLLWQIWGFIAPGLYPSERKYAGPFVGLGTAAFLAGATFCYLAVLPTMFQFLLQAPDATELETRIDQARLREEDALRALRFGDFARAASLAKEGSAAIAEDVKAPLLPLDGADHPSPKVGVAARLSGLGRLMDAAHEGLGTAARPVLRNVMARRQEAITALEQEDFTTSEKLIEEAASALAGVSAANASVFGELWRLERDLSIGQARHAALTWTRPMLTMKEQLSLVLLLELAFGIIFELPLVIALLAMLGIVKASFLFKYQRHALVVCMIAGAIITPTGDAVNLALIMGPMFLCYELGLLAAWFIEKRRAKAAATTALAPPA